MLGGSKVKKNSKGNTRQTRSNRYARETVTRGESSFGEHCKTCLVWTLGLGLGGGLLFAVALGALHLHRVATTSDFFAINQIEIRGVRYFSREEILRAAGLQLGVNSLTVNIEDVEGGLRNNPWVSEVTVKRRLPDAFELRIRERVPVFWKLREGVLYYADSKGEPIAPVTVSNFISLPTLEILPGGEELLPHIDSLLQAFQSAKLPVDMAGVSLFRVSAAKGFEVFLENRNLVLCIAEEEWENNLRRLGVVLTDLARRGELKDAREVWAADGNVWVIVPEST